MHNIMIIDEPVYAKVIAESLLAPEFSVRTIVNNFAHARGLFEIGCLYAIDAIVIDPALDDSGFDLIEQLRITYGFCGRIVVASGSVSLADCEKALRAGGDSYLCKHVGNGDLPRFKSEMQTAIRAQAVVLASEMRYMFTQRPSPPATQMPAA